MCKAYDLIVIGAGPGGYVAAIKAAQLGRRVALVEAREVGGTCLNRGCIPTKAMVHAAQLWQELDQAAQLGLNVTKQGVDFAALHARKDQVVAQLREGVEGLLAANQVEVIRGTGTITAPGTVAVDGVSYRAEHILIATGSAPSLPPIPGLQLPGVVTSDGILATGAPLYPRLCIVGGGVIGVEFASVYAALGAQVTIVELEPRLLPMLDREIAQTLAINFKRQGVEVLTGAGLAQVLPAEDHLLCQVRVKEELREIPADGVLVATGRRACTEGLLGEGSGVDLGLIRGQIPVDPQGRTQVPGIWAIGDVTAGSIQLAHAASAQGVNAVCAMFGAAPPYNLAAIPACIYLHPEVAVVGLTADQAKEQGIPVTTGKYLTAGMGKSLIAMEGRGFIKLVFHGETQALLGAQLMCPRATDMIGGLTTAVARGTTRQELLETVFPHPTFCEGIGEAVEEAGGHSIHTSPRRRI